jgi:hypothetical protein
MGRECAALVCAANAILADRSLTLAAPVSTVYRATHDLGRVKVKGRL